MSRESLDMRYGRQGGRIVPYDGTSPRGDRAPRCDVCGGPMLCGQRNRHHMCDPATIVARRCTCPPGCTGRHVGDGGTCAPGCEPCRILTGVAHHIIEEWRR